RAGAVEDAPDVPVQRDVVQAVLRRLGFPRVLLGVVAQLGDARAPEHGVIVEAHLHVEGENLAVLGDDERVDLYHGGVELPERPVGAQNDRDSLVDLWRGELEPERELAALERPDADRRLDDLPQDRLGLALGDLLDLHPAVRMRHDDDALALAVEDETDVQLALDRQGLLDEQAVHRQALGPRLEGDEGLAQQVLGGLPHLGLARADPDAARFAARAGGDLGFHDPAVAADFGGAVHRLLRAVGNAALRDRDPEADQQLLRLVFVDVHGSGWRGGHGGSRLPARGDRRSGLDDVLG